MEPENFSAKNGGDEFESNTNSASIACGRKTSSTADKRADRRADRRRQYRRQRENLSEQDKEMQRARKRKYSSTKRSHLHTFEIGIILSIISF